MFLLIVPFVADDIITASLDDLDTLAALVAVILAAGESVVNMNDIRRRAPLSWPRHRDVTYQTRTLAAQEPMPQAQEPMPQRHTPRGAA